MFAVAAMLLATGVQAQDIRARKSTDSLKLNQESAKGGKKGGHKADKEKGFGEGSKVKQELGLTDEQSAKLETSRKESGEKLKAIRDDKVLSEEQKKEKSKAILKEQRAAMKSVLTDEQWKKLQEKRKEKREESRKED